MCTLGSLESVAVYLRDIANSLDWAKSLELMAYNFDGIFGHFCWNFIDKFIELLCKMKRIQHFSSMAICLGDYRATLNRETICKYHRDSSNARTHRTISLHKQHIRISIHSFALWTVLMHEQMMINTLKSKLIISNCRYSLHLNAVQWFMLFFVWSWGNFAGESLKIEGKLFIFLKRTKMCGVFLKIFRLMKKKLIETETVKRN